jgi:N-methylhydantoinase A
LAYQIGIDTGGTFTDGVSVDATGILKTAKSATTPKDLTEGITDVIERLAAANGNLSVKDFLGQTQLIIHGTTQPVNSVINKSGPKMGLITTKGHRDVLQLRRILTDNMWHWRRPFPASLIPRWRRLVADERIDHTGKVLIPLKDEDILKAITYFKRLGVKDIVVAFLFSIINTSHEERAREIIAREYPEANVTLSHEVVHTIGEYERFNTAMLDSYVRPALSEYINKLRVMLGENGFHGQLLFMQSNGGVETSDVALLKPATLLLSGPVASVSAGLDFGKRCDYESLLSIDMGGTSLDIALIFKGTVQTKREGLVGDYRISLPMVDTESIGSGGGSIVWIDSTDVLRVGPASAGANPGPACYGLGGEEATLTDVYVVLGILDPNSFHSGETKLRKDLAQEAIKKLADRLGISVEATALTALRISTSIMAHATSRLLAKHGYDPRDFALCAGGGAGGINGLNIAKELDIQRVLIPRLAPFYTAYGMLNMDLRHDFERFYRSLKEKLDIEEVKRLYKEMEQEAHLLEEKEHIPEKERMLTRSIRARYYGQYRDVVATWPAEPITKETIAQAIANFHDRHKVLFGYSNPDYPVEILGFGLTMIGKLPAPILPELNGTRGEGLKGRRDVYFDETTGFVQTEVYDGDKLAYKSKLRGPCIVEHKETTVLIPPGFEVVVDRYGNYKYSVE